MPAARLLLPIAGLVVALYAGELLCSAFPPRDAAQRQAAGRARAARALNVAADMRSRGQVVRAMRATGADVLPLVPIGGDSAAGASLVPLAGISGVLNVACSETGTWLLLRADEAGFNNPPGSWSAPQTSVALIGDSFTYGLCVPRADGFAGLIRARHPASLNAGFVNAGPLIELGILREYVAPHRPEVVLWFYYEGNDLLNLEREKATPAMRYLDSAFTQRLASRQAAVDTMGRRVVATMETESARLRDSAASITLGARLNARIRLRSLRQALWSLRPEPPPCCDLALFERVMRRAAADVRAWGGRVVFVYLPARATLAAAAAAGQLPMSAGDSVLAIAALAGLSVLDLRDSLPRFGPADSLYPYEGAHLSQLGHRAVADLVLRHLAAGDTAR